MEFTNHQNSVSPEVQWIVIWCTYQSMNKQELKSNLEHIQTSTKTKIRKIIQILLTVDCLSKFITSRPEMMTEKSRWFFFLTGEGLWKQMKID